MAAIQISDEFRPLYRVTWRAAPTMPEFEAYLSAMLADMQRADATSRIIIQDSRYGPGLDAAQRRMQADWIKQHDALLRKRAVAIVFVYSSTLLRGMLTAILWLSPLPMPHYVCATLDDTLDLCERILAQHGFPMPRGVRENWLAARAPQPGENVTLRPPPPR